MRFWYEVLVTGFGNRFGSVVVLLLKSRVALMRMSGLAYA